MISSRTLDASIFIQLRREVHKRASSWGDHIEEWDVDAVMVLADDFRVQNCIVVIG